MGLGKTFHRFLKEDDGATAIEYGLIAALIGVAVISGMKSIGTGNASLWGNINTSMNDGLNDNVG